MTTEDLMRAAVRLRASLLLSTLYLGLFALVRPSKGFVVDAAWFILDLLILWVLVRAALYCRVRALLPPEIRALHGMPWVLILYVAALSVVTAMLVISSH